MSYKTGALVYTLAM